MRRPSIQIWSKLAALLLAFWLFVPAPAQAKCTDQQFIDPISDIVWDCIFPISIMGVPLDYGEHPPDDDTTAIYCACPGKRFPADPGLGFMVGFFEPARMVETVSDPWCFPALGMELDGGDIGFGYSGGGTLKRDVANYAFQHYHYFVMPVWAVLDMFTDVPCVTEDPSFDLAMVSEVRPDWGDDLTAAQLYPETALMGNPATILACVADAVAATVQRPIDALYWCMGAWGVTYPMSGAITAKDYVAANAGIASKAMYVQARTGLLPDRAVNYCTQVPMPIWIKSHWRIQQTDPVVDQRCHSIGYPGLLWTERKNPIGLQDNFAWMLFRKVRCCVVVL